MVSLTVNTDQVLDLLKMADARGADLAPAFRACANRIRNDAMRNFRSGGWFPSRWQPSRRGGQTLVDRGTLRNSIHARSDSRSASVGTDVVYAAVHEFGAVIVPRTKKVLRFRVAGRWVSKKSVRIPARPFLPIDAANRLHSGTETYVARTFLRHILGDEGGPRP